MSGWKLLCFRKFPVLRKFPVQKSRPQAVRVRHSARVNKIASPLFMWLSSFKMMLSRKAILQLVRSERINRPVLRPGLALHVDNDGQQNNRTGNHLLIIGGDFQQYDSISDNSYHNST